MEICKAPTLRLKVLKKHSITHIMYIEMEILSAIKKLKIKNEKLAHNVDKGFSSIKNTASVIILILCSAALNTDGKTMPGFVFSSFFS